MKKLVALSAICLAIILLPSATAAQTNDNAIPFSIAARSKKITEFIALPSAPTAKADIIARNSRQDPKGEKAFYFAERLDVALTPENSGAWEITPYGRVWRLAIQSANAYSLYLTFGSFQLNKGSTLFVYSPGLKQLHGAFTEKNNSARHCLSVAPISGDSLIIELNVPSGATEYGCLQLSKVYHDITGLFKKATQTSLANAWEENDQNINCENGIYWQTEKRAVCKIITDGAISTGTLIGNTAKDQRPYLITAAHSMFDEQHAAESIFVFNYEFDCAQTIINDQQTISGASLIALAKDQELDYALLKLNETPPVSYRPYYAGWDTREAAPTNGISIHHPNGSYKQIAIDYHALTTGSFGERYLPNSFWKVEKWDIGFTEPGSSGAPLFNQQHRIVGTLTGGYSSNTYKGSDLFNKLSLSWQAPSKTGNVLKTFLDPGNTGVSFMDGYDPYGFNPANCDIQPNIAAFEHTEISSSGLQSGYISGHNSLRVTNFAEKFTAPVALFVPGCDINVAKVSYSNPTASVKIKIWEGDNVPAKEIYSKTVFLKDIKAGATNHIAFDSVVKVTTAFFIGYQINYNNPADTFAVYHAANRGKNGASSMYVFDGAWHNINSFNSISYSTSLGIAIAQCYGRTYALKKEEIQLYPNPSYNYIKIGTPAGLVIDDVTCYDLLGRKQQIDFRPSEVAHRVFFNLSPGMYILVIRSAGKQFSSKFIVQTQ
jgi:lysyl endopeptidase